MIKQNAVNNCARIVGLMGLLLMFCPSTTWGMSNAVTVAYGSAAGSNMSWVVNALEERYRLVRVNFVVSTNWTLPQVKNYCRQILPHYVDPFQSVSGSFDNYYQQGRNDLPMLTGTGLCARLNMPTNYLDYTPTCYLSRVAQGVSGGGMNYPSGRTNWTTVDYGWEGLTGLVANLKWTKTMPAWCSWNGYSTNYYYAMTNIWAEPTEPFDIYLDDECDPTDDQIKEIIDRHPGFMSHESWHERSGALRCEDIVLRDSCPVPDPSTSFSVTAYRPLFNSIAWKPGNYYCHIATVDYGSHIQFRRIDNHPDSDDDPDHWFGEYSVSCAETMGEENFHIYGCEAMLKVELGQSNYACRVDWYAQESATNWVLSPALKTNCYYAGSSMASADQRIESDAFQSRGEPANVTTNFQCKHETQASTWRTGVRYVDVWSTKKIGFTNECGFVVNAREAVVKWDVAGGLRYSNPP